MCEALKLCASLTLAPETPFSPAHRPRGESAGGRAAGGGGARQVLGRGLPPASHLLDAQARQGGRRHLHSQQVSAVQLTCNARMLLSHSIAAQTVFYN